MWLCRETCVFVGSVVSFEMWILGTFVCSSCVHDTTFMPPATANFLFSPVVQHLQYSCFFLHSVYVFFSALCVNFRLFTQKTHNILQPATRSSTAVYTSCVYVYSICSFFCYCRHCCGIRGLCAAFTLLMLLAFTRSQCRVATEPISRHSFRFRIVVRVEENVFFYFVLLLSFA